jgi:hypothetical protein
MPEKSAFDTKDMPKKSAFGSFNMQEEQPYTGLKTRKFGESEIITTKP